MQELSGGAPPSGEAPRRIEAGPGGYDQGGEQRDLKPWQRGPTGGPAPWQRRDDRRDDHGHRDQGAAPPWAGGGGRGDRGDRPDRGGDSYGYGSHGAAGYAAAPGAAAPWQQPPPPGGYGYGSYGSFAAPPAMGAPPGISGAPPGLGGVPPPPPPGMPTMYPGYPGANPPPPPPPADGPPPPVWFPSLPNNPDFNNKVTNYGL